MPDEFFAKLNTLFADPTLSATERADLRLRVLADRFAASADAAPSDATSSDLTDIMTALTQAIDLASSRACQQVAKRIAAHPRATPDLLQHLIDHDEATAAVALRYARSVDHTAASDIAERGAASAAVALAGRDDLVPALFTVLLRRPERDVLIALLRNPRCSLDRAAAGWLVTRARRDDAVARALLDRGRLACDLTPLFLVAGRATRHAMIADWRRRDLGAVPERRQAASPELIAALATAIAAEDWPALAEQLARRLGIGRSDADRFVRDGGGEPLALAFNAAGFPRDLFVATATRLLEMSPDDPTVVQLESLSADLPIGTARRILAAIVGRPLAGAAAIERRRHELGQGEIPTFARRAGVPATKRG